MPTTREISAVIRGAQAVQQVRRKMNLDAGVSRLVVDSSDQTSATEPQTIAAGSSLIAQPTLSSELSQALTLSGLLNPNLQSANIQVKVESSSAFTGLGMAVSSSPPSKEDREREQSFVSLGDRMIGQTNTPPDTETLIFENTLTYPSPAVFEANGDELDQNDLLLLRDAAASYIKRQLLFDPDISEEDLQTSVDSVFGEGFSDLFHLRQVDFGSGRSEIHLNQLKISDVTSEDDKNLLVSAFSYATESFKAGNHHPVYEGGDVDEAVEGIRSALGINAEVVVRELEDSLRSGENIQEKFQAVSHWMEDFSVDSATQQKVFSYLNEISSIASRAQTAFSKDPFFDDFKIFYQSGRYAIAHTSEDITESAELTAEEWDFQKFKI